jgi:phosphatidylglycerophosphatase A
MKIKLAYMIATWFGSGLLKPASGTWGTLASLPFVVPIVYIYGSLGIILGSFGLFCIGLWAAHIYEIETGEHDSSRIVIDEVVGMLIAATPLLIHFDWVMVLICFVLFRLLDAWKVGLVGWCDKNVTGAFGVMIDDVVAGLLTAIVILGVMQWI